MVVEHERTDKFKAEDWDFNNSLPYGIVEAIEKIDSSHLYDLQDLVNKKMKSVTGVGLAWQLVLDCELDQVGFDDASDDEEEEMMVKMMATSSLSDGAAQAEKFYGSPMRRNKKNTGA